MKNSRKAQLEALDKLLTVMDELRAGCPWDQKQTFESLRPLTIEETYELSQAILNQQPDEIKKELGDLLLHIVFYAKIGSENAAFDMADVAQSITEKLIKRHPHIYGDVHVENEEEVKQNWEKLKLNEGNKSVLAGVPSQLPPLVKAHRIQEKAAGIGFDWPTPDGAQQKIIEELNELKSALEHGSDSEKEEELGDVIFSLVNYSRLLGFNADTALERTNLKFMKRFLWMEEKASLNDKKLSDYKLDELEALWQEAKKH